MLSLENLFPVHLFANWQNQAPSRLSKVLVDWLFDANSLTARLKNNCQVFEVKLLGQNVIACPQNEACDVINAGEQVLAREVLLYCDGQPHVFARSLLPLRSLTGEQQVLADLGTQPLGQVIFNNPSLERKLIQVAEFGQETSVGELAGVMAMKLNGPLWGRRSLFYLEGKPLVVAEVFLPLAKAYL
ncbi:MAG: chorismate--pyruvate lyase family protein [Thalassotalea sp.]